MKRVGIIVGTRPEAIKMAPVIRALAASSILQPVTICTSQHEHMVPQVFQDFGIKRFHDLRVMRPQQTLWDLSSRLLAKLGQFFQSHPLDAVLVQGDTSSALFGGLSAFYHQIPVGHVEAGLRTGNLSAPFPEEMNRKLLTGLARWHFAPTRQAAMRLRKEGVPSKSIYVTGNTVVDALRWMAPRCSKEHVQRLIGPERLKRRLLLVTCHRRENFGTPMQAIAGALAQIAQRNPELVILFPVHPNPSVRSIMEPALKSLPNVVLCPPLAYHEFLACLKHAWLVLSDSGGVQEEATALGKPVLVLREHTERPEGIQAGALKLVGASPARILRETTRLLRDPRAYARMSRASTIFGDGRAAERIAQILAREL